VGWWKQRSRELCAMSETKTPWAMCRELRAKENQEYTGGLVRWKRVNS